MCAIHLLSKWSLADLFQTQIQNRMKNSLNTPSLLFLIFPSSDYTNQQASRKYEKKKYFNCVVKYRIVHKNFPTKILYDCIMK